MDGPIFNLKPGDVKDTPNISSKSGLIHVTERQVFKRCRRKWDYEYRQNLKPIRENMTALWLGRGLHHGLASFYLGKDPIKEVNWWFKQTIPYSTLQGMSSEEYRELEDCRSLVLGMLEGYKQKYSTDEWSVIAVERPIKRQIAGTYGVLVGTIDLLIRMNGRLWVVDHKGYKTFVDPATLELDDQMTAYLWMVWQEYKEMPAGAIYNQLRKKLPVEPTLLKDGKRLSKDKSIDTTYDKYLEAILLNGFDQDEYSDILTKLANENRFYIREPIARNKKELYSFEQMLNLEYRDMCNPRVRIYPNPTSDCIYDCPFRTLCKVQNEGGDVDGIKATLYKVQEGRVL